MCDEHFYALVPRARRLHKMFYGLKIPFHGFICHTQSMAVSKGVEWRGFSAMILLIDVCSIGRQTFSAQCEKVCYFSIFIGIMAEVVWTPELSEFRSKDKVWLDERSR
jgi:hypothetical protein